MSWLVFCVNICVCVSEKCPDSIVGTCSFKLHALLSVCPLAVRPLNPPLFRAPVCVTALRFHRVVVDKTTGRNASNCRRWSVITTRRKHDATRRDGDAIENVIATETGVSVTLQRSYSASEML